MLNVQTIERNACETQLILQRNFINEFIKSNHKKRRKNNSIKSQSQHIKFSMKNLLRRKRKERRHYRSDDELQLKHKQTFKKR